MVIYMLSQEQGVQEDCLITYRALADYLKFKLSSVNKFNLEMMYMVGSPGLDGKLLVEIAQHRDSRNFPIHNGTEGEFLFLLEGELPGDVKDPYFLRLGRKYSMYFLVDSNHISDFMKIYIRVYAGTLKKNDKSSDKSSDKNIYTLNNLDKYGRIVLAKMNDPAMPEVEELFFGKPFDERYALSSIGELDANFVIKENVANVENCSGASVDIGEKKAPRRKLLKSLSEKFCKASKLKYERIDRPEEKIKNAASSINKQQNTKWYVEPISNKKNLLSNDTYL